MIYVTKTYLPPLDEYTKYLEGIWERSYLTNQGPLLQELEKQLRYYFDVANLHFLNNGTIALQLALNALDITEGEIITTPFSYVATTSSILWERCEPVFVDIEPNNFCIDADKIEAAITPKTKAIMAVHVFGYACNVEKIQRIADKHNLKIIYDAAHAFGTMYKGKSLVSYGDISTISFHATKLFHTAEGGACVVKDKAVSDKLDIIKRFGHNIDDHICLGVNGKASELCAAMGLCNFNHLPEIFKARKEISELYDKELEGIVCRPKKQEGLDEYNYAYYPVIFKSEEELLEVFKELKRENIFPRRYFYPSLNNLPYLESKHYKCLVSEDISKRIACLPLYVGLEYENILKICKIVKDTLCEKRL